MTIKIQGDKITFPDDSEQTTAYDGSSGGGVPEAPIDGKEYARKDAEWVEVTGGDAVAFRGELLANQTVAGSTMTKVNLDTSSIDTDSALVDGKFKPSVAGYYQVNGAVGAYCVPPSDNTNVTLFKNGVVYSSGSQISMAGLNSARSVVSDVIYLNGTTDYLELHGFVTSTGTTAIDSSDTNTFLSAVLVTGGTGTGGGTPSVDTAIGMVAPFAMDSVPTGWLHCDGSAVSRTTYSLLYSKVADLYGAGDGSTTFNLPNLKDEFIRGSSDTLEVGNKQGQSLQSHTHSILQPNGATSVGGTVMGNYGVTNGLASDGSGETRPRNVAMLYCINATAEPSSGGGSYTPEKMVWEDVTAERTFDTVYTNTNDVPLYVQLDLSSPKDGACNFIIDGSRQGTVGCYNTAAASYVYDSPLYICLLYTSDAADE